MKKKSVIAYIDESGDDGMIKYSSNIFILTALYMHASNWNENYELLKRFRQYLKDNYKIPIKEEFHTAHFFKDKDPYRRYNLTNEDRKKLYFYMQKLLEI